jgi:hypothetical protein
METIKPQIVVASYKENLWWVPKIKKLGYDIVVYNTGPHGAFCFSLDDNMEMSNLQEVEHIKLPNTDREAGQFLYHIVTQKNNLADYTLFLQADLGWSCCNHEKHLLGASEGAVEKLIAWLEQSSDSRADFLSYEHTRPEYRQTNTHDEEVFKDIMEPLGALRCPYATAVGTNGGQFRVSKNKITSLPDSYLDGLLDMSNKKPLAHRLEWSWGLIFDSSKASFTPAEQDLE